MLENAKNKRIAKSAMLHLGLVMTLLVAGPAQ